MPSGPAASCCVVKNGRSSVTSYDVNWSSYCAPPSPSIVKVCIRLFKASATAAVGPPGRNAIPSGVSNSPLELPGAPKLPRYPPSDPITCTRSCDPSDTSTTLESRPYAMPSMLENPADPVSAIARAVELPMHVVGRSSSVHAWLCPCAECRPLCSPSRALTICRPCPSRDVMATVEPSSDTSM